MVSILVDILLILAYTIGISMGYKLSKDKEPKLPAIKTPKKAITEYKENKELKKEQEKLNQLYKDIDEY